MYLSYEEYTKNYNGTIEENDYINLERKARKTIDLYTYNRVSKLNEVPGEVKECILDLIEYETILNENNGKEISSESVDTHSVTYAVDTSKDIVKHTKKQIVKDYLIHTGLMYRGVI